MEFVQVGVKILAMAVFLGYALIWVMMPTNTFYLQWLPFLLAKTDTTYLGNEGAYILIYTLPILFLAILGCFSLHLRKKNTRHISTRLMENPRWVSWKRPIITEGPLGIVSWTELSFSAMFIALLIWSVSSYFHGIFSDDGVVLSWEKKVESSGIFLGLVGNISLSFLFFPVTRGSSILQLIGLTSESAIKYHIWLAHITLFFFTSHGLCYIILWVKTHQIYQIVEWQKIGTSTMAGELSLLCGLVMWATSFRRIRRKIFELFFYTHQLYILFVIFYIFHVGFSYSFIMLPGFYLFLIDRYLRFLQSQQPVRLVSARVLPCEAVELNFSKRKNLHYTPTSIVFVNVPEISKLQWHPFTITSSSLMDSEKVSVVIKSEGSWSTELYRKLSLPEFPDRVEVSVEGPYGHVSTNLCRHEKLVMISGGSGITPFISIIRELLFISNTQTKTTLPQILLICAFKKSLDLTMLDLLLPDSGTGRHISGLQIQIEAYVTREKEPAIENQNQKLIQVLLFKPYKSDSPFSAVLGLNNFLWCGITIIFSFLSFLLFLGIQTRFYVYPVDKNSNSAFSHPLKNALSLLCLCAAILMAATATFIWKKKERNCEEEEEEIQIRNTEKWSENGERELESFPHQSLIQATTVHYGQRPHLERILGECGESRTGVVVSGPRRMRQEVAAICSSTHSHRLHFESISFSW